MIKTQYATLSQILTGSIAYDSSWGVYAQKINGEFTNQSAARFGQTFFENGGLLDDCVFFANNESITDSIDAWCDGNDDATQEAAEMLISEINDRAE